MALDLLRILEMKTQPKNVASLAAFLTTNMLSEDCRLVAKNDHCI